jgi:hypothetical protein
VLPATHSLHFRVHTRVLLTLFVACAVTAALWAEAPARVLLREATEAQRAGQLDLALQKLEAAHALRPDYPRLQLQLARACAAADRTADALAQLHALAAAGLALDLSRDNALAPLRSLPEWKSLADEFAANDAPRGHADIALTLPARDGIIESAVADAKGRWFFADVRNRCIWLRETDGTIREFSGPRDGLLGVFGLAIDEKRGSLWAGVSAVPEIKNFSKADQGWAYLAEYDLTTGAYRRSIQVPNPGRGHVLGSVVTAPDGSVFASDSTAPTVWRLAPGASQLEAWLESDEFTSLQGLAFTAEGKTLYLADYSSGLWHIDVATKNLRLLAAPARSTLVGLDDLQLAGHTLIAVQNGTSPQRVVRIALDDRGELKHVETLAAALSTMTDSATGCVRDGRYYFVGNSGWSLFEKPDAAPAPREVHLLSVSLQPRHP